MMYINPMILCLENTEKSQKKARKSSKNDKFDFCPPGCSEVAPGSPIELLCPRDNHRTLTDTGAQIGDSTTSHGGAQWSHFCDKNNENPLIFTHFEMGFNDQNDDFLTTNITSPKLPHGVQDHSGHAYGPGNDCYDSL